MAVTPLDSNLGVITTEHPPPKKKDKKRKADARVTMQKMNSSSAVMWPCPNLQRHEVGMTASQPWHQISPQLLNLTLS